jgi:hypothetical protein
MKYLIVIIIFLGLTSSWGKTSQIDRKVSYWMARHLDLIASNKRHMTKLFKRFEKKQIIGLELIVAESSSSRVESRYGHAMLHFVDNVGSVGDDLLLSFVANVESPRISLLKGIFGGYAVYPRVKPMREFVSDYIKNENRSLKRFIIPLPDDLKKTMGSTLKQWWGEFLEKEKSINEVASLKAKKKALKKVKKLKLKEYELFPLGSPDLSEVYAWTILSNGVHVDTIAVKVKGEPIQEMGRYTFFSNNCAGALVNFIRKVGLPVRKTRGLLGRVPVKLEKYFRKMLLSPWPAIEVSRISGIKEKGLSLLNLDEEKRAQFIEKLDQKEILIILDIYREYPLKLKRKLRQALTTLTDGQKKMSFDQVYGVEHIDESLYGFCFKKSCAATHVELAKSFWGESRVKQHWLLHRKNIKRIHKNKLRSYWEKRPEFTEFWRMLDQEM